MKRRKSTGLRRTPTLAQERMDTTLALTDFGEEALRRRLRRMRPAISEAEIGAAVAAWYHTRPGAELGDSVGRPRTLEGRR